MSPIRSTIAASISDEHLDVDDEGLSSGGASAAASVDVSTTSADASLDVPASEDVEASDDHPVRRWRWSTWKKFVSFGLLPVVALGFAAVAGYLKYLDSTMREADIARVQSVAAATEGAVALLSYNPDDVEAKLTAAQGKITGSFRDSYASLIKDVIIPGARKQKVTATAVVPAAASILATGRHAEVMVFVNQTIAMGNGAPTETASAVDVVLDKVGDRWLISGFDPK